MVTKLTSKGLRVRRPTDPQGQRLVRIARREWSPSPRSPGDGRSVDALIEDPNGELQPLLSRAREFICRIPATGLPSSKQWGSRTIPISGGSLTRGH